jgi:hypothetical protein
LASRRPGMPCWSGECHSDALLSSCGRTIFGALPRIIKLKSRLGEVAYVQTPPNQECAAAVV